MTFRVAIGRPGDRLSTFCGLLAALYLMVRGIDNWLEGVKANNAREAKSKVVATAGPVDEVGRL